jgi:hypothetical protein
MAKLLGEPGIWCEVILINFVNIIISDENSFHTRK